MRINSYQQKIFLRFFGVVIFCVFALMGCAKKEIKNIDSKGKNIICFGDSLTFGYGATGGEDYPYALAKMVNRPLINMGVDGDTTIEALKRLKSDVLDRDSLLVIVEFGGNDFLRKIPREITVKNVEEMIEKIQAQQAMVAIVDISAGIFLREYRQAFRNIARKKGAIFIPSILNGIITNPDMRSDFLHPNANGYKTIAERIYRAIKPHLKQNSLLRKSANQVN